MIFVIFFHFKRAFYSSEHLEKLNWKINFLYEFLQSLLKILGMRLFFESQKIQIHEFLDALLEFYFKYNLFYYE